VVSGIPVWSEGGKHFHYQRTTIVTAVVGDSKWMFEDIFGRVRYCILKQGHSIVIPTFIYFTYESLTPDGVLFVVTNTIDVPGDRAADDRRDHETLEQLRIHHEMVD